MSKVFPDKKFGLWKREGMENLSDNEEEDDENEKNEDGKKCKWCNSCLCAEVPWVDASLYFSFLKTQLWTLKHTLCAYIVFLFALGSNMIFREDEKKTKN